MQTEVSSLLPLATSGNSWRSIDFGSKVVGSCNFHVYLQAPDPPPVLMASLHTTQVQPATKDRHSDKWGGRECLLSRHRAHLSCSVYLRPPIPTPYCFLPPEGLSMDGWVIRDPPSLHPSGTDKQLRWQAEIASDLHVFTSQSAPPTTTSRPGERDPPSH